METMAHAIWHDMAPGLKETSLTSLGILIKESDVASALYSAPLSVNSVGSYKVTVTDRIMVSHSFKGPEFGPAQKLHGHILFFHDLHVSSPGATFVMKVDFAGRKLDDCACLVDVILAEKIVKESVAPYHYRRVSLSSRVITLRHRNLDEMEEFAGVNTTMETVARRVWENVNTKLMNYSPDHTIETVRTIYLCFASCFSGTGRRP